MNVTQRPAARAADQSERPCHRLWRSARRTGGEVGDRVARLAAGIRALGAQARRPGRGADRSTPTAISKLYLGIAWAGAVIVPHQHPLEPRRDRGLAARLPRLGACSSDKAFAAMGVELAKAVSLELIYADDDAGPAEARTTRN